MKILGEYMKPTAVFPDCGLGAGSTEGCKAVKVIKLLCKHAINLSTMDVASAIDAVSYTHLTLPTKRIV